MRMKYRSNLTKDEEHTLLRELAMLDNAYAEAEKLGILHGTHKRLHECNEDGYAELVKAALNHRGQP